MNRCVTIYSRAEQLADQVKRQDAHGAAAAAVLKTINALRVQAIEELEDLTEAIDNIDLNHPKVGGALEALEEVAYENVEYNHGLYTADEAAEMADEMIWDRSYNSIYNLLHRYGVSDHAVGRVREALLGEDNEDEWPPERLELLLALARSFEPHTAPVDLDAAPEE